MHWPEAGQGARRLERWLLPLPTPASSDCLSWLPRHLQRLLIGLLEQHEHVAVGADGRGGTHPGLHLQAAVGGGIRGRHQRQASSLWAPQHPAGVSSTRALMLFPAPPGINPAELCGSAVHWGAHLSALADVAARGNVGPQSMQPLAVHRVGLERQAEGRRQ